MRVTNTNGGLKVYAVAGTYVVMFGFDLPQADCDDLTGFSIHRADHTENEAYFLEGMKAFAETDSGIPRRLSGDPAMTALTPNVEAISPLPGLFRRDRAFDAEEVLRQTLGREEHGSSRWWVGQR